MADFQAQRAAAGKPVFGIKPGMGIACPVLFPGQGDKGMAGITRPGTGQGDGGGKKPGKAGEV